MAYIESNARPVNAKTYDSSDAAIAAFVAPDWVGAPVKEIKMISADCFRHMGVTYCVRNGENPTAARRESRAAAPVAKKTGSAMYRSGGSTWLSRDMDRADSNN